MQTVRYGFAAVAALIAGWVSCFADDPRVADIARGRQADGSDARPGVPLGTPPRRPATGRYRYQNGRWFFLSADNKWFVWSDGRWISHPTFAQQSDRPVPGGATETPSFRRRFAAFRDYDIGERLQTAEGGNAELATDEIEGPAEESEAFDVGGIPPQQAERGHAGISRAAAQRPEWFNTGSPFGIRHGYGSGFGYSGYGFNNPYGYGPRTGGGGGFSYGFGPYGSVGGQTGMQVGGGSTLISSEPSSLGAPSQLEKGPVGGSVNRASRRKLGGSASSSGGE
jgi:hypothetical protein